MSAEITAFNKWMQKVNAQLVHMCSLASEDLADVDYWCMFASGMTPREAAIEVLEENDFLFEDDE